MRSRVRHFFLLIALSVVHGLHAQQNDVPLQRDFYIDLERNAARLDTQVFSGLKPVIQSRADLTNVMGHRMDSTKYYYWATEKLFRDHLFLIKGDDFKLTLDPLFQFEGGLDLGDATAYSDTNRYVHNTRGLRITGDLGGKLSFQTMFHENQALVPQYLSNLALATRVLPGQGRVKVDKRTLDFGWSQANVSYTPVAWLNVQLGQGKHFVGHGYRSVLLSDNTIPSPYVKFSAMTPDRKLQYTTWHSKLMHGVREADRLPTGDGSESLFYWMRARFNHLGLALGRFDIGLFESTVFQNIDEDGVLPFDPMELNPVIGVNTAVFGFDGPGKSLVGVDLRVKVTDKAYVYGQFGTDAPSGDRHAWQAGVRVFDLFIPELHLQVEYNAARPFMYMNDPAQLAYMHAGLPLAHPMGAYFNEAVVIVDHHIKRFYFQGKVNMATYHLDRSLDENHGSNLYKPDEPSLSAEGPLVRNLFFLDLNSSYLFNPVSNMRVMIGFRRRDLTDAPDAQQSGYLYLAFRTGLFNSYYDL